MLNQQISQIIAAELTVQPQQILAAIQLLDDGNTIPFIARYRKEATGGLDDTQLRHFETRLIYLRELEDRRQTILKSIEEQGKLTDELREKNPCDTKQNRIRRFVFAIQTETSHQKGKLRLKPVLSHWLIYFGTSQKMILKRQPRNL